MIDSPEISIMKSDKNTFIKMIQENYKAKIGLAIKNDNK
jgi:hypothetical protein